MLELGDSAENSHRKLFNYALEHNIEVWWLKNDFKILGEKILGKNFHCPGKAKQMEVVLQLKNELKKEDTILLEGRINKEIVGIFGI
jgi:UDP-N-acetylmuramyl pentapeptide synthase